MSISILEIILGAVVAVLTVALAGGLIAGQFRKGIVDELRAALETAQAEIDIQRSRGDRLDTQVKVLTAQIATLTAENQLLGMQLKSGMRLAPEFQQILAAQMDEYQRRIEKTLMAGWAHRDEQESAHFDKTIVALDKLFREADARMVRRHRVLAEVLPALEQAALIKALDSEPSDFKMPNA